MRLNQSARDLIGEGANATIVTMDPSGTPNVSVVCDFPAPGRAAKLRYTYSSRKDWWNRAVEAMTSANRADLQSNSLTWKQAS